MSESEGIPNIKKIRICSRCESYAGHSLGDDFIGCKVGKWRLNGRPDKETFQNNLDIAKNCDQYSVISEEEREAIYERLKQTKNENRKKQNQSNR